MATSLSNLGTTFDSQSNNLISNSSKLQPSTMEEDDDDVVFIEPSPLPISAPTQLDQTKVPFTTTKPEAFQKGEPKTLSSKDSGTQLEKVSEPIVIDDEEDIETNLGQEKIVSSVSEGRFVEPNRTSELELTTSKFPRSLVNAGLASSGITTEPDSEIQIANVTTLDGDLNSVSNVQLEPPEGGDMNLMITNVTSLQNSGIGNVGNGHQSNNFGINMQMYTPPLTSQTKAGIGSFNPGRVNTSGEVFQNGESLVHHIPDSWISQSASFPRNQKQPGADSMSPVGSLPKPVFQPPAPQQSSKPVKVTCANCKKPLQKGQTAYQRKGSAHLFCSTTCLSAFSHKPAPKKLCTMCKKDITTMKGTIVAQVESSESFQEFCSTSCLSMYEDKQNASKGNSNKSRCTVCGKLTEIRHEVSFKNMTHKLCSDHCFNRYRMANGLVMNCCEQCGEYLPSKGAANNFLLIDGQQKRFCCQNCLNEYKQKHGKITSCTGCRTPCRYFDMTQCIGPNGNMEPYCSTACMNSHKAKYTRPQSAGIICHFCKRNALPQYQATMPDGKLYNFCSSGCVAKFQTLSVQSTNGQIVSSTDVQLKCSYCKSSFSSKPEVLEWENKVYQFCSKPCCDDYKKLHCIVSYCEYCQEEKTLHETIKFSGVKRPFCSEGCKLLYKQDFARRLGLKCVTCNYCSQMCKKGATKEIDGVVRDFCSEDCAKKFKDWYFKATRCDCCKTQGTLRETVQWRGEMKHFCDQHCLLRFYCQQNEPNMSTQKGPENMQFDQGSQVSRSKMVGPNISSSAPPPSPTSQKEMKNKAVLCKPLTMTKATYCKPHMQTKSCQTEEDVKTQYVPVPIPVPVYIPIPMHMYSQNTPIPVSVPVPVPVPVFLPTTLDSAERIVETIEELKAKVPSDPVEADILAMAEMIAEAEEKTEEKQSFNEEGESEITQLSKCASEEQASIPDVMYEKELDLEIDFPRATEELDTENEFLLPLVFGEEYEEQPKPQVKKKGAKRKAVFGHHSQDGSPEYRFPFNYAYGVNAWKHWVLTKNSDEHGLEIDDLKSAKAVRLKEDLQSHTADELSCGLARFVHEIRRPNGESYAPDSIYYLCLGIQKYLYENSRTDNIFSDPGYQMFDQELTKILRSWQPSILPDGSIFSRVEEDYLWSAKQLGSHSPVVLLNTLLYFNTKYFGLKTVEQHLRLSFGNIVRQWKKNPLTKENTVCLQYQVPSLCGDDTEVAHGKRKHEDDDDLIFEQRENTVNPSQCPVKMFECYLSKSPQSLTQRMDVFYLQPDFSSFQKDGAMWYTTTPLDRSTLENMLARVLLIKDIYDEKDSYELDDDNE
ncbi:zinc finger MYM-type protein 2 isoform X2 [Latimeria chalumnae]|uniref:zinc finger MYM-type protein 2 isoform X2 n=1 Tax=Latimeria chalumnae TaxID=7897 RepID=UPI00313CEAF9